VSDVGEPVLFSLLERQYQVPDRTLGLFLMEGLLLLQGGYEDCLHGQLIDPQPIFFELPLQKPPFVVFPVELEPLLGLPELLVEGDLVR
jgi:hypothetical protein